MHLFFRFCLILIVLTNQSKAASFTGFQTQEDDSGLVLELYFDQAVTAQKRFQAQGNVHIVKVPGAKPQGVTGRQELSHLLAISFHAKVMRGQMEFWLYPRGHFGVELLPQMDPMTIRMKFLNGYPLRSTLNPTGSKKVICIDPGHGGHDPGAPGVVSKEKEVVLAIARRLKDLINGTPGYVAFLTRNSDYKIRLEDRPKISDRAGADLFISLHMNSSVPKVKGYEVFYLSEKGADQTIEANMEESHSQGSSSPETQEADTEAAVPIGDPIIRQILLDMQQVETLNSSAVLAARIAKSMGQTGRRNRGVRRAAFVVLKTLNTPSVLIEMGYITNREEETYFNSDPGQQAVAAALKQGIVEYLEEQVSPVTDIATAPSQVMTRSEGAITPQFSIYQVKAGDTLGSLAVRMGVRYVDLLSANPGLHPDKITVGQKLKIPELKR